MRNSLFVATLSAFGFIPLAQAQRSNLQADSAATEVVAMQIDMSMRLNSRIDSLQEKVTTIINGDITVGSLIRRIRERESARSSSTQEKPDSARAELQHKIDSLSALRLPSDKYQFKLDSIRRQVPQLPSGRLEERAGALQADATKPIGDLESEINRPVNSLENEIDKAPDLMSTERLQTSELNEKIAGVKNIQREQIKRIEEIGQVQSVKAKVTEADVLVDKAQAYQKDAANLVQGNIGELEAVPDAVEKRVASLDEFQDLQKQTGEITKYQKLVAGGNDPEALRALAKQQAIKYAKDHFLGKEAALMAAMDKLSKVKSTYADVASLKGFPKRVPNQMKVKPFVERIVPGFQFQIQKSTSVLLDLSPTIGYRITGRFTAGLGWNERISFKQWNQTVADDRIFGPRAFTLVNFKNGFSLKAEGERMNVAVPTFVNPSAGRLGTIESHRAWIWSVFAGVQKDFAFYKSIRGNVQFLYNLYEDHGNSPYVDRFNVRMGFEFPLKRSPNCQVDK